MTKPIVRKPIVRGKIDAIGEVEEMDGTPLKVEPVRYVYSGGRGGGYRQAGKTRQLLKMAHDSVMAGKTVAVVRGSEVIVVSLANKELKS